MAAVVSWKSGEVFDCEALSKHCAKCNHWELADKTSDDYIQWYEGHKDHCTWNFVGSSPAMEAAGV